jgi:ribosomal protein S18 acetylase RimI-like enzyme
VSAGTTVEVTRTYLQMTRPDQLRGACVEDPDVRLEQARRCPVSFYRYLYREVGRRYHWVDRLPWSDGQVRAHLDQEALSLWVLHVQGSPAGLFELLRHHDGSVEIAYFGLLPEFHGRGLGKHLLTEAVTRAWAERPSRVWLHTCTLDDPAALPNYTARGFEAFKQETYLATLPEAAK